MEIPFMFEWEIKKGMGLLATGDWTHPLWIRELKKNLDEDGSGILSLKKEIKNKIKIPEGVIEPKFLLSTEISSIYTQGGKGRRIHLLLWVPDFKTADLIISEFLKRKVNLSSDGRPIMSIPADEIVKISLSVNPKTLIIPAHIWTPWFSVFGSMSGFNSLKECFGEEEKYIYGIETGLSSDPTMNWRIPELDTRAILSFSDAHSGAKLGREATAFNLESFSYNDLYKSIVNPDEKNNVAYTIEFYPEEGKYHFTGHRICNISYSPEETKQKGIICPVCHRPLTVGVMHRVEELSKRKEKDLNLVNWGKNVKGVKTNKFNRPPFVKIVPLAEIIAEVLHSAPQTKKVTEIYDKLVSEFKGEFNVLLKTEIDEIKKTSSKEIGEAIEKVRHQDITVIPGFDGNFGIVKIETNKPINTNRNNSPTSPTTSFNGQISLF